MSNRQKPGIFKRIFIIYALIIAVAVLFIELSITDAVRENHIKVLGNNLVVQANLISQSIAFDASFPLDEDCRRLKKTTGSRVTIVAANGKVIGDSDTDSSRMENHANREEIQQASLKGSGMAIRFSSTLKYDLLYTAVTVARRGTPAGFVRISMPLKEVDASVNLLRIKILSVVFSILLISVIFSISQFERIRRLTRQIRDFAEALVGGEFGKRIFMQRKGEFDDIAESLNTMSDELKNTIAAHDEEKRRLNTVLRSIPDALFIIDGKGVIVLSSVAARKLFGETALHGRPYIEIVRNTEFLSLMETVRGEERPASAEIRIDVPLQQYCIVQASPLFYEDRNLSGFVVIFHDITRLKNLEQTRKDFVANISHEIRTPITAIQGFADTLLEGALADRDHALKFLQTIKSNSERINNLVEDLLTISRIELGVIRVEKSAVDIREVADHVIASLRDKAAARNLVIKTDLIQAPQLQADRKRLVQILTNLLDNAIKFTDKGGVTIGVAVENESVCLFVEDTGIGIAQKHLPRLGERFYRVDPGRSRSMGGTGLGLAIVRHLVKAHGWDMQIESRTGKGTKVKILII